MAVDWVCVGPTDRVPGRVQNACKNRNARAGVSDLCYVFGRSSSDGHNVCRGIMGSDLCIVAVRIPSNWLEHISGREDTNEHVLIGIGRGRNTTLIYASCA